MIRLVVVNGGARPRVRDDCADSPRPCPWISCRHHLAEIVLTASSLQVAGEELAADADRAAVERFTARAADAIAAIDTVSCALDFVDRHPEGATLEEIAVELDLTRERVRQIEARAVKRSLRHARRRGLDDFAFAIASCADPHIAVGPGDADG